MFLFDFNFHELGLPVKGGGGNGNQRSQLRERKKRIHDTVATLGNGEQESRTESGFHDDSRALWNP